MSKKMESSGDNKILFLFLRKVNLKPWNVFVGLGRVIVRTFFFCSNDSRYVRELRRIKLLSHGINETANQLERISRLD